MADMDSKIEGADELEFAPLATERAAETRKRAWLRPLLMFGVPALILGVVGWFWATSGGTVSTDNAYVRQDKVSVASEVGGRIVEVAVRENQVVKAGDVLFRIDPEPYRLQVAQANASIATAQVQVQTLRTSYNSTGAEIHAAQDQLTAAQQDYARQSELMTRGFTTRARLEQAQHSVEQARAAVSRAEGDAAEARAKLSTGSAVPGENPQIAASRVQREQAEWNLARTTVRAPTAGTISQADRLQVGQMMMTGLPAVTIVGGRPPWIEANFKETDLDKMRVGQRAWATFDAYPGLRLKCHVASIGALTGSEKSILPAQNATGNWVKVTQRVPVRIECDEHSPRPMIAGLSVAITIDVE
jgi:membrane fusion protein (multidrug efflux system)